VAAAGTASSGNAGLDIVENYHARQAAPADCELGFHNQAKGAMIRILLVHEVRDTLLTLQGQLRRARSQWQVDFACGSQDALQQMDRAEFDVVVADLRLSGMDGAELLEKVRQRRPQAARVAICEQATVGDMHRVMPVAHQVLSECAEVSDLVRSIERIHNLLCRRDQAGVKRVLGMLTKLPVLPRVYWELAAELERANADAASVAKVVEQDPVLTSRVLQLSNSAFFGTQRQVRSVRDAATLLGLEPLRSIALFSGLSRSVHPGDLPRSFSLDALQSHSVRVARLAASMLADPVESKTAFSAGMLHHIGCLLLAANMPQEYETLRETAFARATSVDNVEREVLGCDHAEIGGQTLSLWGLPLPLIEAVVCHHRPSAAGETRFGAAAAVHVASVLADEAEGLQPGADALELPYLRRIGAAGPVLRWRSGEPVRAF